MNPILLYHLGSKTKIMDFISTWKTDNISTGSTDTNQIKLPLSVNGVYNFTVYWGDGTSNLITTYNQAETTHTYAAIGTYQIKIVGSIRGFTFSNTGDRLKILSIQNWGKLQFTTASTTVGAFFGCANLTLTDVKDVPDLPGSHALCLESMLRGCTSLTTIKNLDKWNIINQTNMTYLFHSSTNFNDPGMSSWNTSNVTVMQGVFLGTKFNYPLPWNTSKVTNFSLIFNDAVNFNQNLNSWDVSKATTFASMFEGATNFNNGLGYGVSGSMPWIINTSASVTMSLMFYNAVGFNQNISTWNVSRVTSFNTMFANCAKFNQPLQNWTINTTAPVNMGDMFEDCDEFNQNLNSWNTSRVTDMSSMFANNAIFNNGLAPGVAGVLTWDTSNVTSMNSMFSQADSFNQDIGSWNLTNVTTISAMFSGADVFNNGNSPSINNWNTINVTTMNSTFLNAVKFNQPLNLWNVTKVTSFTSMFSGASIFNQNLNSWVINTSAPVTMGTMFNNAIAFNNGGGSLNSWNTSTVTAMNNMFDSTVFNQDISSWNTGQVTTMSGMFATNKVFNQNIGTWNVSNVTTFGSINTGMFTGAIAFNQNLSSWNVSKVTSFISMFQSASAFNNGLASGVSGTMPWTINTTAAVSMQNMFFNAIAFNQDIGSWNTSRVTSVSAMFNNAPAFNQNIGSWNVSNVTVFANFMTGKTPATFSTVNLDAIYNGWINFELKPTMSINFSTAKYTAAGAEGRALLTRANSTLSLTSITNNGSGLVRVVGMTHGLATNNKVFFKNVPVQYGINNKMYAVTVIDANTFDLQGSTVASTGSTSGNYIKGYGWTVTDGGV